MDAHLRRHSIGSSTGSLSDDLLYSNTHSAPPTALSYPSGPADTSYAFSDTDSPHLDLHHSRPSSSRRSSFAHTSPLAPPAVPPSLVPLGTLGTLPGTPKPSSTAPTPTGRSRARAFSFLGAHDAYGDRHDAAGTTPHTGATPFVGSAYDSAFELGDDEADGDGLDEGDGASDDGLEMREVGRAGGTAAAAAAAAKARTSGYRTRFQPLVSYELAWMAASAASVLGLTVAAVVLAFVG
ncbi:hypothetical protein JCM8208_007409 [Rhodotorula glutinis]